MKVWDGIKVYFATNIKRISNMSKADLRRVKKVSNF